MMHDMMILHFTEQHGNSEYVIFMDDTDADTDDFKRPGYMLKNAIFLDDFPRHRLPLGSVLLKDD